MIEIAQLTDDDIGRRVVWTVAPGAENPALLAAWTKDTLVLAIHTTKHEGLHMVEGINPANVRWADRLSNFTGETK